MRFITCKDQYHEGPRTLPETRFHNDKNAKTGKQQRCKQCQIHRSWKNRQTIHYRYHLKKRLEKEKRSRKVIRELREKRLTLTKYINDNSLSPHVTGKKLDNSNKENIIMPSIDLEALQQAFASQPEGETGIPLPDGSRKVIRIFVKIIEGREAVSKSGKQYTQVEITYSDIERDTTTSKKVALFDRVQAGLILEMELNKTYDVTAEKKNSFWIWQEAELVED